MNNKKITKISEIQKIIECPCGKGKMKLEMIYVIPRNGKIGLSYSKCNRPFCSYERGILMRTDIIIP